MIFVITLDDRVARVYSVLIDRLGVRISVAKRFAPLIGTCKFAKKLICFKAASRLVQSPNTKGMLEGLLS